MARSAVVPSTLSHRACTITFPWHFNFAFFAPAYSFIRMDGIFAIHLGFPLIPSYTVSIGFSSRVTGTITYTCTISSPAGDREAPRRILEAGGDRARGEYERQPAFLVIHLAVYWAAHLVTAYITIDIGAGGIARLYRTRAPTLVKAETVASISILPCLTDGTVPCLLFMPARTRRLHGSRQNIASGGRPGATVDHVLDLDRDCPSPGQQYSEFSAFPGFVIPLAALFLVTSIELPLSFYVCLLARCIARPKIVQVCMHGPYLRQSRCLRVAFDASIPSGLLVKKLQLELMGASGSRRRRHRHCSF
ncbi:hypothetical protein DENSPDRAFT_854468 [Dentipellis sp. KUC8613]|nr:hypothetical protein DENSPDRAFT_854468 [Dentipellis sp. KUC8613]